jgi:hypothetical protein
MPQAATATEVPSAVLAENNPLFAGYITREKLAVQLGCSIRTLDRLHAERSGPPRISPVRPGASHSRLILYKVSEVTKWLDSLQTKPCRTRTSRRSRRAA